MGSTVARTGLLQSTPSAQKDSAIVVGFDPGSKRRTKDGDRWLVELLQFLDTPSASKVLGKHEVSALQVRRFARFATLAGLFMHKFHILLGHKIGKRGFTHRSGQRLRGSAQVSVPDVGAQ